MTHTQNSTFPAAASRAIESGGMSGGGRIGVWCGLSDLNPPAAMEKKLPNGGLYIGHEPTIPGPELIYELLTLRSTWRQRAYRKIEDAKHAKELDFKRALEHAGMCYFNAAIELDECLSRHGVCVELPPSVYRTESMPSMTPSHSAPPVVIEDGDEWLVSFGGSNPKPEECVVLSKEDAWKLHDLIMRIDPSLWAHTKDVSSCPK